ncbi:MAG: DUF928 domain-containing protein [Leptolyngbyaceae cyanobacterium]
MMQRLIVHHAKFIRRMTCLTSSISLLLLGTPSFAGYTPPQDARIPRTDHTGGGVRGCGGEIAALAPRLQSVGHSLSSRPTFVWYVLSDEPQPVEFHLYRYQPDGALEEVLIHSVGQSTKGYMTYTLPSDHPDLAVGETYLWQVMLYCDQNLEDIDAWSTADIQVVSPLPALTAGLSGDPLQRAQAYAQSGYWYEAIATIYDATSPDAQAFRQSLLLDLADLETPPEGDLSTQEQTLIEQLRAIANLE